MHLSQQVGALLPYLLRHLHCHLPPAQLSEVDAAKGAFANLLQQADVMPYARSARGCG